MPATVHKKPSFPITLRDDEIAKEPGELVEIIVRESDQQIAEKVEEMDGLDIPDFKLSCDALNFWRLIWRCKEEWGESREFIGFQDWLRDTVCLRRDHDPEEFALAMQATSQRVRVPYGLMPLDVAYRKMRKQPIRILVEGLQENKLLSSIAGVAVHLRDLEYRSYIMLPTENLRQLFNVRKVSISGALQLLINHGLLQDTGARYGTGRARQFYCTAEPGRHFEFVTSKHPKKPMAGRGNSNGKGGHDPAEHSSASVRVHL
jgi:hypothetical protein